jgi:hypothetical protein
MLVIEVRHLDGGLGLGLFCNTNQQMHYNQIAGDLDMAQNMQRDDGDQAR